MNKSKATYTRSQVAKATDVKGETIRYYEKCGLLKAPPRSTVGYRIYSQEHVTHLNFIRRCRELGFTINEIDGLLNLASVPGESCEQVQQTTTVHLREVQKKIDDLKKMEMTLKMLVSKCKNNTKLSCPIIDDLFS